MEKAKRNELVDLIRPLVGHVLTSCRFARAGAPISAATLKGEILRILEQIRTDCENKPALRRDFERVERPLVFFIDYMIKEGGLPFSSEWTELARDYDELSGDEKFFDMLSDALEDPDAKDRLQVFYFLLGCGFDGSHHGEGDFLERRMRLCATRFAELRPLGAKELFDRAQIAEPAQKRPRRMLAAVMIIALTFAAGALAFNAVRLGQDTADFRAAVNSCREAAWKAVSK